MPDTPTLTARVAELFRQGDAGVERQSLTVEVPPCISPTACIVLWCEVPDVRTTVGSLTDRS